MATTSDSELVILAQFCLTLLFFEKTAQWTYFFDEMQICVSLEKSGYQTISQQSQLVHEVIF